jgi:hypothetical protein
MTNKCALCGEPMPVGEEMFTYHGASGPCPKPPLPRPKTTVHIAKSEHEVAYQDITALIAKHAGKLSPLELLAVAGNMVGKLMALQDQRTTTAAKAIETLNANIEAGNKQVVDELMGVKGIKQ